MIRNETGPQVALVAAPFETFFQEEYASVAKALFLLVGNPGEAEDLAEDAFARARAPRTTPPELFSRREP